LSNIELKVDGISESETPSYIKIHKPVVKK